MILLNGVPATEIDITDRGLHYGDGLFETILIREGRAPLWPSHLQRLLHGCKALALPGPDIDELEREIYLAAADQKHAVIKLMLTRGSGPRGYAAPDNPKMNRILIRSPSSAWPEEHYDNGIDVWLCETPVGNSPATNGLKSLSRLDQVIASNELKAVRQPFPEIVEGLMRNTRGFVCDGTKTNLFVVTGNKIQTPDLSCGGVAGVMRAIVVDQLKSSRLEITDLSLDNVLAADELFLSNAVIGLCPVRGIRFADDKGSSTYHAYSNAPGPVTRALMQENRIQ